MIPSMAAGAGRKAIVAAIVVLLALLATVLGSVFVTPQASLPIRIGLAGFIVLAVLRPDAAVLVTTTFLGFGVILAHLGGAPDVRVPELLVAATIAGCAARALADAPLRAALARRTTAPVVLLAIATIASAIVWQRVQQFQTGFAADYARALFEFASRDYFVNPREFRALTSSAVVLEGLGLFVVAGALCATDRTFFERALRMTAIGGAALGLTSVQRLLEVLLRNPDAIAAMRATSVGLRISPQIGDYIAAGSYFALCWLVALGLAMAERRGRPGWILVGVPTLVALFLTGSRSVIAAALAGVLVLAVVAFRQHAVRLRGPLAFAGVVIAIMIAAYPWMTGRDVAGEMARQSLTVRSELIRAGMGVAATRPVFGVGVDRFYLLAEEHASPELKRMWTGRLNPHNDFLRFGAELGLVGLACFVWILGLAVRDTSRAVRITGDMRLAGLAAGITAFLVTSLISNPLMVREVAYLFWIALGLAVGHASTTRTSVAGAAGHVVPPGRGRRSVVTALGVWIVAAVLLASIPVRANREIATLDPGRVSYGLYDWTEEDGVTARWTGPEATLFIEADARAVDLPLAGAHQLSTQQQVEILVDGRLANRVTVGAQWQQLRVLFLPRADNRAHRIDLLVSPTWVPAEIDPGVDDRRVLGVRVGRITVVPGAQRSP